MGILSSIFHTNSYAWLPVIRHPISCHPFQNQCPKVRGFNFYHAIFIFTDGLEESRYKNMDVTHTFGMKPATVFVLFHVLIHFAGKKFTLSELLHITYFIHGFCCVVSTYFAYSTEFDSASLLWNRSAMRNYIEYCKINKAYYRKSGELVDNYVHES